MNAVAALFDFRLLFLRLLAMVPCHDGNFNDSEQDAECREKPLRALPVLLVALHAMFEFGNTSAISIAYEAVHMRL